MVNDLKGISLFSSGGIADLALRALGIRMLVANEVLKDRASLFKKNFPDCEMIVGDIRQEKHNIIASTKKNLENEELDILFATPPCQGMSKNGRGKLLSLIRSGVRPALDERNRLIIDALDIALALKPRLIIFENVPEMQYTVIENETGDLVGIIDYITQKLGPNYIGDCHVFEFADYGVPQKRQRLITAYSRDRNIQQLLKSALWRTKATHSRTPGPKQKEWVSVDKAIAHLEPLDAKTNLTAAGSHPLHKVPILDEEKYFWVSMTPEGAGAFDNQCVNPKCLSQNNPTHGNSKDMKGINKASKETPIHCIECGERLPRPWVKKDDKYKLMSGFTSAYKRMRGDLPASALTRNLSYACSDKKLHPRQNRVLSLFEALIIHTVNQYKYEWVSDDGKKISHKTIREVIGESIPPKGLEIIITPMINQLKINEDFSKERKITKTA